MATESARKWVIELVDPSPLPYFQPSTAGWSSPVARQAHNLKVIGSNPIPATNSPSAKSALGLTFFGG